MNPTTVYTVDAEYSRSVVSTRLLELLDGISKSGDIYNIKLTPDIEIKTYDDAEKFAIEAFGDSTMGVYQYDHLSAIFYRTNSKEIICVEINEDHPEETMVRGWGSKDLIQKLKTKERPKNREVSIRWTYSDQRGMFDAKKFYLKDANKMYDEYCPFINGGIESFIDSYLKSKAPILVLLGPPGTGKTSFIRHMLYTRNINAQVTFDEKVMTSDSYFIDYMASKEDDIMVVEDADVLLTSRKEGGNKVMSKLLNISDGLVPILSKKIIFSTNMDDITEIDPALIRPGRCFDVIHFRQLSHEEAERACERAGLSPIEHTSKEYTLSEVFNGRINDPPKRKKIGF